LRGGPRSTYILDAYAPVASVLPLIVLPDALTVIVEAGSPEMSSKHIYKPSVAEAMGSVTVFAPVALMNKNTLVIPPTKLTELLADVMMET
jgi:hypothetical protein